MGQRREAAVDLADQLVHLVPQLDVARRVAPHDRRRDLHQLDLACPGRVGGEELVDGEQLVRDALDVVHAVDAQHDLLPVEAALQLDDLKCGEARYTRPHTGVVGRGRGPG